MNMYCIAIGEYNKQAKDIMEAMAAYQLNFEDAADRLGIKVTPKLREIYNECVDNTFKKLSSSGEVDLADRQGFEAMLA
jgi:hypothetical protein